VYTDGIVLISTIYITGASMNKTDLTEALASKVAIPQRQAKAIVKTILETMTSALACGEPVEIRGLGSFTVREYDAYEGRNPKTGERTIVKPKKLPFFKPGKELKEQVNEGIYG
jgi:integration host factor subunit beta